MIAFLRGFFGAVIGGLLLLGLWHTAQTYQLIYANQRNIQQIVQILQAKGLLTP